MPPKPKCRAKPHIEFGTGLLRARYVAKARAECHFAVHFNMQVMNLQVDVAGESGYPRRSAFFGRRNALASQGVNDVKCDDVIRHVGHHHVDIAIAQSLGSFSIIFRIANSLFCGVIVV